MNTQTTNQDDSAKQNSGKLYFARFEFKYILSQSRREQIESELNYFMDLDPFVVAKHDNCYFVRSLYFDDRAYTSFYEKIDGVHSRAKFRLRTYGNQPEDQAPLFLELKRRDDNLVTKHRVLLRPNACDGPCAADPLVEDILRCFDGGLVVQQFEYELYRRQLRPIALIDYRRRPYVSKFDPEFRLTFDDCLQCTSTNSLFPSTNSSSRRGLSGYTIMEVKFRFHVPSWFHRIIQSYELRRESISKICRGVEVLQLADNLS